MDQLIMFIFVVLCSLQDFQFNDTLFCQYSKVPILYLFRLVQGGCVFCDFYGSLVLHNSKFFSFASLPLHQPIANGCFSFAFPFYLSQKLWVLESAPSNYMYLKSSPYHLCSDTGFFSNFQAEDGFMLCPSFLDPSQAWLLFPLFSLCLVFVQVCFFSFLSFVLFCFWRKHWEMEAQVALVVFSCLRRPQKWLHFERKASFLLSERKHCENTICIFAKTTTNMLPRSKRP